MLLALRLWPHAPLSADVPGSTAILARDSQLLRLTLAADEHYRLWLPLGDISPTLKDAVQLYEDRWFYWHPGVNPVALARAAIATYTGGNRQGASTLTMQLARLKYRLDTRTPSGKLKQIALALWLEARYSKRDILDAYLNFAPYGRNIAGVGAASLIYFGKPAAQLTLPESLTLAVIPQSPSRRAGSSASLTAARNRLFANWKAAYSVSPANIRLMTLPVPARPLAQLPFRAPHFVEQVVAEHHPRGPVKTTLDQGLQNVLERQIRQYLAQVGARGIHNASALLIDTRDMGVRALVGSADYFDGDIAGQVNGTDAKRSPGSTLKPFLYGLALDQGLIHPRSILKDSPTAFGPFQPENFDGRFVGPIAAQDALIRSRNIPAVWLAGSLKRPTLYDFLRDAGVAQLKSEEHYGLALTLGGGEVTMQELATMYALVANDGVLKSLRMLESTPNQPGPRLLSSEASFIVLDMLSQNPRPDGIAQARSRPWFTAWKTGTSWGFRDAWTAGVIGPYVLVVWLGNFDGSANPSLVGIDMAAPLFFRIADALMLARPREPQPKHLPPSDLKRVAVCADSGDLPNAWCPRTVPTWFIPGISPIKVSTLHQPVVVDNRSGRPACPPFDPGSTHTEIYEFWDSDMARLFREAGMPRRTPPRAECDGKLGITDNPPRITSPINNVTYTLRLSRPDETLALQAIAAADAKTLFWFDNQSLLGQAEPKTGGLAWRPTGGGWHQLTVVDDQGRSASRQLRVEMQP
ncbi:penicillin-binding protein 1C [Andreprevotia chitinilytica]|uniref:penicillin-binding protein 1C n=1 Tax=Andreprevotia chitinilytica TaxID=396808 RepID=UPI00068D4D98|nr:penicillin-binding protein 1C [Andreprevotia chitinilytica]